MQRCVITWGVHKFGGRDTHAGQDPLLLIEARAAGLVFVLPRVSMNPSVYLGGELLGFVLSGRRIAASMLTHHHGLNQQPANSWQVTVALLTRSNARTQ